MYEYIVYMYNVYLKCDLSAHIEKYMYHELMCCDFR